MTPDEFKVSLLAPAPPPETPPLPRALWHDANDEWEAAHEIAQEVNTPEGAWVHAYLHRKEGDLQNASFWYRSANRTMPAGTLQQEWDEIVNHLLSKSWPSSVS